MLVLRWIWFDPHIVLLCWERAWHTPDWLTNFKGELGKRVSLGYLLQALNSFSLTSYFSIAMLLLKEDQFIIEAKMLQLFSLMRRSLVVAYVKVRKTCAVFAGVSTPSLYFKFPTTIIYFFFYPGCFIYLFWNYCSLNRFPNCLKWFLVFFKVKQKQVELPLSSLVFVICATSRETLCASSQVRAEWCSVRRQPSWLSELARITW